MTNEEIEKYSFKHFSINMTLFQAAYLLRSLMSSEDYQINSASPNWEMRSEAQAEAKGITQWQCYDREIYCKLPMHHSRSIFVKTSLGWMNLCCAKDLGLERLPNTYIQPTEEEIMAAYADKKNELGMIVNYQQRLANIKGAATRKARADKLAAAKAAKIAEKVAKKLAMTPEEVADKKAERAQRKAEKAFKELWGITIKN